MEYLYLPTTTLNFNNILSTGSISPAACYSARQFGFKQFEVVEPNPFSNVLLLYDRFPEFAIKDNERDNYPLVLRLRFDSLPLNLVKRPGVKFNIYSYSETIYCNPSSTELLFNSQDALQIALTKSKLSLATKLVELFRPYVRIYSPGELDAFEWSREMLSGMSDGGKDMVIKICEADSRINRLKGFVTGYIIGAYKSISPKMADGRSNFRAVRNFVSEILNDPRISNSMRKELESACTTFEAFFAEVGIGSRRFDPDQGDGIGIEGGILTFLRDQEKTGERSTKSLLYLVNNFCLTSDFYGQLDEKRFDVAKEGAEVILTLIGDAWKGSTYQVYINALLNNIKSGTAFDFDSSDSLTMKSFAAFILKGDDLEKLEAFLTVHGIGDFRITFALWGAMFGFSQIPENFYNLPFSQGEGDYARKMHSYTYSLIHGVAQNELRRKTITPKERSVEPIAPAAELPISMDNQALVDQLQQKFPGASPWHPKLLELLQASGGFGKIFIDKFNKPKVTSLWPKTKKGTKKKEVVDFFREVLKSSPPLNESVTIPLFSQQKTAIFWSDAGVWDDLRMVVHFNQQHLFLDRLRWFQNEWSNPHSAYYGRRKPLAQRTNAEAITAFCNHLDNKKFLSEKELEDVRDCLMTRYSKP
ncbi:MAG: hypothetical protein HGB26_03395 [Desulfobulbaceae bacterium]|nr:hypothetical protein [Desulfobulbaceae bacterium]